MLGVSVTVGVTVAGVGVTDSVAAGVAAVVVILGVIDGVTGDRLGVGDT